jgi:RNA polymerase sigma factor (sigma-70 family)
MQPFFVNLHLVILRTIMQADEQLIDGCKKGDRTAQRNLYEKYSRRMFGICMRYCDSREEAEEILQEGLLKVFQKIEAFKGEGSLESWMKKIMINTALDVYRKNKNRQAETEWQDHLNIGTEALSELKAKDLLVFIRLLPKGFRTVFNLYAVEGYNHNEIGKMLGISEGTSKSQYARARAYLIKLMEKENQAVIRQVTEIKAADGLLPLNVL